jgi:nicotinamide-nucleotide amidase
VTIKPVLDTFAKLQNNVDLVTGGLGPTKDDVTKKTFVIILKMNWL